MKNYELPENIKLLRIPPYCPELNPSERIWQYIKQYYKNNVFENLDKVKQWLYEFVKNKLNQETIKAITNHNYMVKSFLAHFNV